MPGSRIVTTLAGLLALAVALGCGGFMEDQVLDGDAAARRLGGIAGATLPAGVRGARSVETTGIDWLYVGEFSGPRSALEPWFDALSLPCDTPTVSDGEGTPGFHDALAPGSWSSPGDARWRLKRCEGSTYSGPHYGVSITLEGDPAWVWVHGLTM